MSTKSDIGRIVWHDLLTHDVVKAREFYAELLGWKYQIEHASEFVWQPGEADYPLILANGFAHGGFVNSGHSILPHWVAYVAVEDVDAVTAKAKVLGAAINREPFDTPEVGRGAVIRDPQGAVICPFVSTHSFPPPGGTFLWDELITDDVEPIKLFYGELFGWQTHNVDRGRYTVFKCADGTDVAGVMKQSFSETRPASWLTYLATGDDVDTTVAKAKILGASVHLEGTNMPSSRQFAILSDPTGAMFGLLSPVR